MDHPSILGVLALILQALYVNGRGDLRSLFVLRETENVGLPACDHNSCKRIDIDYAALLGGRGALGPVRAKRLGLPRLGQHALRIAWQDSDVHLEGSFIMASVIQY